MKITKDNLKDIFIIKNTKDVTLLYALLDDINEINDKLTTDKHLYIDIQDYHDEYSPERTDPCPDYYGYYTIRSEKKPSEIIGDYYDINDLDNAILIINNFINLIGKLNF